MADDTDTDTDTDTKTTTTTTINEKNITAEYNNVPSIQILTKQNHIDECCKVMANAFKDSPAYMYMFQELTSQQRYNFFEWLFHINIQLSISKDPTVLRGILDPNNENKVICCFLFTKSPNDELPTWELIKAGLWQLPYRCGSFTALKRLLNAIDAHETDGKQHFDHNEQPYVQLERMAVLPDYQGKGIGTKALKETFQQHFLSQQQTKDDSDSSNSDSPPRPIRLSTQEERNVEFYKRLGFEIILQNSKFKDTKFGYDNWMMVLKKKTQE